MRRFLAILGCVVGLLSFGAPADAQQPWQMRSFRADIEVFEDGVIEVRETIGAEFLIPRHGIFRYIPEEGAFTDGRRYRLGARLVGVTLDGRPEPVHAYAENGNLVWRIGREDVTMTGPHTYVITYQVRNAVGRFDAFDEVYWNVTGHGWDVPLPTVAAVVSLPESVRARELTTACYTGPIGSTDAQCQIIAGGGQAGFVTKQAGLPMTVAVGWPKGLVGEPGLDWERIIGLIVMAGLFLAAPVLALIVMYVKWKREGKDLPFGPVVVQYEPPAGMTPAETLALQSQIGSTGTIAATVVDLAVRGFLAIEEYDRPGLLGPSKDYRLRFMKDRNDPALKSFERGLLADLHLYSGIDQVVELAALKMKFYRHAAAFPKAVQAELVAGGYYESDPAKARSRFSTAAGVFAILGLMAFAGTKFLAGLSFLLTAVIIGAFGWSMAKWSAKGHAQAWHARGFREFVTKVEKHRAPWMEKVGYFNTVLPFAIAYGVGRKWASTFAGILTQPPDWYRGASIGAFSAAAFADDLNKMAASFTTAATSSPRSSDSGSDGGGSSGGGGGGGGGGSW